MFFLLNLNILKEKKKILLREEFMTQEDNQLLLTDLCARLPYKVKVFDDMGRTYPLNVGNAYFIDLQIHTLHAVFIISGGA